MGYHCTFAVSTDHVIDLPARTMLVEDFANSRLAPGTEYQWPNAVDKSGKVIDLRKVTDPSSHMHEFHYGTDLAEGWLAVTDSRDKIGMDAAAFPKEILSTIYLWINYGYWKGCYNVGLYPMNRFPASLSRAIENGKTNRLGSGESLECEAKFVAYSGLSEVKRISRDGRVT